MKYLVKTILLFPVVLLFFSCQVQRSIAGKYTVIQQEKYPKVIPITFYIELKNDSTFTYNFRGGFHGKVSTGFWKEDKNNKKIIISSFIQDIHKIPIIVKETVNNDNSSPLFVFDNPLKLDISVRWTLNVNDIEYPLNIDSLILDKGIIVKSFYLTGHIALRANENIIPIPLQDTIQSRKYNVMNLSNNVYNIAFPTFVNYDIFYYKPLYDSLKLRRKVLWFEGIKLKKE